MGLKKKIFKYLGIGFACAFSIFLLGNCEKVSAGNFEYYKSGTKITDITYNEGEMYVDTNTSANMQYSYGYMFFKNGATYSVTRYDFDNSTGDITGYYIFPSCSYSSTATNPLTCSNYYYISYDNSSSIELLSGSLQVKFTADFMVANSYRVSVGFTDAEGNSLSAIGTSLYKETYDKASYNENYNKGKTDGMSSADITSNDEQVIEDYCSVNTCLTNEEYETNINNAKQEGKESVDITTDNQAYADKYIADNNYHSNEEYLQYGEEQKQIGIDSVDIEGAIDTYIEENKMKTQEEYFKYGNQKYLDGVASVDTESDNEYHYQLGFEDGVESVDIESDNEEVFNQGYEQCKTDRSFKTKWTNFWKDIGELFKKFSTKIGLTKKEEMAV